MSYNFYNNTIKKQTTGFTPSNIYSGNSFGTESFRYDSKQSLPIPTSQVSFDMRTNPFFNPVTEKEVDADQVREKVLLKLQQMESKLLAKMKIEEELSKRVKQLTGKK